FGDLELRGLYTLEAAKDLRYRILANFGVGLPTGSINLRDTEGMRMEYPMQTGSGTFSLLPGITYLGQELPWGWAADFNSTVRLGRNDNGYRLGNRYPSSVSIARQLTNVVSVSAGAHGELWENIDGSDPLLDPTDEPTKDPNLQGGKRLSALLGITFHPQNGLLKVSIFTSNAGRRSCNPWTARNCKGDGFSGWVGRWNSDPMISSRPQHSQDHSKNTFSGTLARTKQINESNRT